MPVLPDLLLPDDHVRGPEGAPVLLVYADFECPYCQAAQGILRRVEERLEGGLRRVYRHFPLRQRHPRADAAAEAAEAAAAQGRFWPMHDALFAQRGRLEDHDLRAAAVVAEVPDPDAVLAAVAAGTHAPRVERDLAHGREDGVQATPAFLAQGVLVPGAFDARSLIEALRGAPPT